MAVSVFGQYWVIIGTAHELMGSEYLGPVAQLRDPWYQDMEAI
jgi:hypothetical protein